MNGICKISDFGISKRTDDIEQAGAYTSMQGTVFWMAPEVINAQKGGYNSKVDIWSVGCVVYEMWTGQRPWNGQEAMAVLLHVSYRYLRMIILYSPLTSRSCIKIVSLLHCLKASPYRCWRMTSGRNVSPCEYVWSNFAAVI